MAEVFIAFLVLKAFTIKRKLSLSPRFPNLKSILFSLDCFVEADKSWNPNNVLAKRKTSLSYFSLKKICTLLGSLGDASIRGSPKV
jgi:hypothetical protein